MKKAILIPAIAIIIAAAILLGVSSGLSAVKEATAQAELTAKQAIEASKTMMDGYKGDLFVLGLTFLGWDILNVFTLGIGSFWLNPYKEAAYAAFYRQLLAEQRETSVE